MRNLWLRTQHSFKCKYYLFPLRIIIPDSAGSLMGDLQVRGRLWAGEVVPVSDRAALTPKHVDSVWLRAQGCKAPPCLWDGNLREGTWKAAGCRFGTHGQESSTNLAYFVQACSPVSGTCSPTLVFSWKLLRHHPQGTNYLQHYCTLQVVRLEASGVDWRAQVWMCDAGNVTWTFCASVSLTARLGC